MNEDVIKYEVMAARYRWLGEKQPQNNQQRTPLTEQEAELLRRRDMELARQNAEALLSTKFRLSKGLAAVATTDIIFNEALVENDRRDSETKPKKKK